MKTLDGKFCRRCSGKKMTIAAEGEVLIVRCLDCSYESKFCPNPRCSGAMYDLYPQYKEQKCTECNYTTSYMESSEQLRLFE